MHRFAPLLLVMFLSICSVLQGMSQPAPPIADHPQEIRRDRSNGLQRLGMASALTKGSPDDTLTEIHAKATVTKIDYYVVLLVDETVVTGQWYSQAVLYHK